MDGPLETYYLLSLFEGLAVAAVTAYLLWGRVPHPAIAVASGMAAIWVYFRILTRKVGLAWLLFPRMIMWGTAFAGTTMFICTWLGIEVDKRWYAVPALGGAVFILSNAYHARRNFRSLFVVSNPRDSEADETFVVLVLLEAIGLALLVAYILWGYKASVSYLFGASSFAVEATEVGILVAAGFLGLGYNTVARDRRSINLLLIPRMVLWAAVTALVIWFAKEHRVFVFDYGWQVFSASAGAALIFWNGRLTKRKLCSTCTLRAKARFVT